MQRERTLTRVVQKTVFIIKLYVIRKSHEKNGCYSDGKRAPKPIGDCFYQRALSR